jgi:hypothetical protein
MSTTAWSTPKAHMQASAQVFCFQCGNERRPVMAVGVDEDGEPACVGHQVKGKMTVESIEPAPSTQVVYEPAAAPSPVQTSAVEAKAMRNEPNFKPKQCIDCDVDFIPTGARSQRCEGCAINRETATNKKKKAIKLPPTKVVGISVLNAAPASETAPIHLSAEKFDKLWNLLSLADKAAAIEHVL